MQKMKTLFQRDWSNRKVVNIATTPTPGTEWVLDGEGIATRKIDGTCVLIRDNQIYARYDYKPGRKLPDNAIPCQDAADPVTGHFPHWVLVTDQPDYKYYVKAFDKQKPLPEGTYELVGRHFAKNIDGFVSDDTDILIKHGSIILDNVPCDFEGIREYLKNNHIEGIVFHRENGEMCKIKRSDFGFEWKVK